ncbi:glycoside hydrolase family 20 zincin-like fold domain-containing protein, partial [Paramuribaculum intestinale]
MTISKSILTALALAAIVPAWGQDTFDLQSQRKEVQNYLAVPGEKLDHKGIIINPTPHSLETNGAGTLGIADGFKLKGDQRYEADLLKASIPTSWKGTLLTIATGAKAAKKQKVEAKEGAYRLTVDKNGVTITGYDDKGAFYGIQTLRQLVESPIASNGTLPYLTIADYPDLPHR